MIDPQQLSPTAQRLLGMIEFDESEKIVCEIRKHPFGLFVIELTGFLVAAVLLVTFIALGALASDSGIATGANAGAVRSMLAVAGIVASGIVIVATLIGGHIYKSNVILVTNEKLAQVLYHNIIHRSISQLSIGDVQDVTVRQHSLFARIFKYGTLVIETAGEQQNLTFTYVPMPYDAARGIVGAHELNLKEYGN
jgi:hypothetical protein